jgi:UDP-sulfoquinovose synthase
MNQFTETFSVNDLAERVRYAGARLKMDVTIGNLPNPRIEAEEHYYNPEHTKLLDLGLEPHPLTSDVIEDLLLRINAHRDRIDPSKIQPRVRWTA